MFKVGQSVSKDEIFAAGWMIESFSVGLKDLTLVNEEETLGVTFSGNSEIGVVYSNV